MRRGYWAPLVCLAATMVSLPARAQPRTANAPTESSDGSQTIDQRKAQEHFQRAKELYQTGKYSGAAAELEIARQLDPKAKDLVINLGIVHEKLGKYDEALAYLATYLEMEGVTPAERTKVEGMIRRIEGAKRAVAAQQEAAPPVETPPPPAPPAPKEEPVPLPAPPPPHGRVDAWTIAAGSAAIVGLGLGAGLGVYALSTRPNGFVTGRDGTYATLQQKTHDAHTAALVADVSLGVGVVAALTTAWLYFGRTKVPGNDVDLTNGSGVSIRSALGPRGAQLFLGGAF